LISVREVRARNVAVASVPEAFRGFQDGFSAFLDDSAIAFQLEPGDAIGWHASSPFVRVGDDTTEIPRAFDAIPRWKVNRRRLARMIDQPHRRGGLPARSRPGIGLGGKYAARAENLKPGTRFFRRAESALTPSLRMPDLSELQAFPHEASQPPHIGLSCPVDNAVRKSI
jgi:hypothetical protein